MDEIDYGDIARLLSSLSGKQKLPEQTQGTSASEFSEGDVRFNDNSWLARVKDVQVWLRLEDAIEPHKSDTENAGRLLSQLAPDAGDPLYTLSDGVILLTEQGVEALETRLARADELSTRFIEALDEGNSRAKASAQWLEAWDEPEVREPPKIKATVLTWPIAEFVGRAEDDELELNPSYQREYIWSNPNSQKLIESILRGIPLPSIILASVDADEKLQIVDGKQRLTSILRFVGAHPAAISFATKKGDIDLFRSNFRRFAKKHALTPDDIRKNYLPFKTRNFESSDPLRPLSGKYYDEIKQTPIMFGGKLTAIRKIFNSFSSPYSIPILRYEDTAVRDIHQVFQIYNQQGVKLNAEEIRNAAFNHLKIIQLMLFISGDRYETGMAEYAVVAGVDPSFAHQVINDMGFSVARFRRTKVLLWMLATVLQPTATKDGKHATPSTATHIDNFLREVDSELPRLRSIEVLTTLAQDLVAAITLHADAENAWHPRFRSKREAGSKWEELGAVSGLAACLIVVILGQSQKLLASVDQLRNLTKEKKGPESTQNKTQWAHIADSLLSILDVVQIGPDEASAALMERFGTSGIDSLLALKKDNLTIQKTVADA